MAWPGFPHAQTDAPADDEIAAEAESPKVETVEDLLARLADPDERDWERVQDQIVRLWSRSGSDSMDLLLMRGRKAMREGDLVKALHHLSALVDHAPDFAEGWNARATAFFMHGEYGQALADIERVLELEPRHFGALSGLGLILDQLDQEEAALAAYRETLKLNPHIDRIREAAERLEPKIDGRKT
jgi:tetratricopeptide (TPR) repeat protein